MIQKFEKNLTKVKYFKINRSELSDEYIEIGNIVHIIMKAREEKIINDVLNHKDSNKNFKKYHAKIHELIQKKSVFTFSICAVD